MAQVEKKAMMRVVNTIMIVGLVLITLSRCTTGTNNRIIKGKVFEDNSLKPLFQATILLKHKDSLNNERHYLKGTSSDSTGYFEIEIEGEVDQQMLFIGYVGYKVLRIYDLEEALEMNAFYLKTDKSGHVELPNH